MDKMRVLQIGAGSFGQGWLQIVRDYPETELTGVVDVLKENLAMAGQITGLSEEYLFNDLNKAFKEVEADMVLIVTPQQTHKELAIKALESGLHVMMEKPMTHAYEEAIQLLEATRNYTQKVMVSQNYRWRAPIQTVKKLLCEGKIGKVGYMEYAFRKAYKIGGWRDHRPEILLEDMSIHHFDIIRYLLEKEPADIFAQSFQPPWSWFKGKPCATAVFRFRDDIHVNYFGSWVSRGHQTSWIGDIRIVGSKGAIELINDEVHILLGEDLEIKEHIPVELVELPYNDRAMSLNEMISSIRENRMPLTSVEDNIHSFEMTCAAIESAQSGANICFADFSKIPPKG